MEFKISRYCDTSIKVNGYGNVLLGSGMNIELTFYDPDVNTVKVECPGEEGLVTVHEVVFKVSCQGQIQGGFYTQLVKGMESSTQKEIIDVAIELITAV
ncbi:TPA: hypothetical protein SLO60_001808 [Klebsiella aerogenes]|nr:hypothetical protein [Klebsiella aerogenes]HEJ0123682.1 hypothetical protein [Klebsiella aerogenes]